MDDQQSRFRHWIRKGGPKVLAFIALWLTGKVGAVEVLVGYIFPEADSFGSAQVSLVPFLPASVSASRVDAEAVQLLVLKNSKRESQVVTILTESTSLIPAPLLVGGIGADPLPRPAEGGLPPSRVLLDADVPSKSVLVVGAPATSASRALDEQGYSYRTELVVVDSHEDATLTFKTANESRGTHVLYWMVIGVALPVCFTAGRARPISSPRAGKKKESSDRGREVAPNRYRRSSGLA